MMVPPQRLGRLVNGRSGQTVADFRKPQRQEVVNNVSGLDYAELCGPGLNNTAWTLRRGYMSRR